MLAYLALTLALIPVQWTAIRRGWPLRFELPRRYHRLVCRILGLDVELRGRMSEQRPTLFVANHVSYLDIEVLGSVIPGSFVAKSEVAGWPLFGLLAKLQRSVFVDRRQRSAFEQRDGVAARLGAGEAIILFPEGTSSDGTRLRPFKSALFAVADLRIGDRAVTVQPVTVAYTRLDGMPIGRALRPYFAWYGDMTLGSHLWHVLKLRRITASVEFHKPVTLEAFGSRKRLAEHCERVIAEGLAGANAGRLPEATDLLVAAASEIPGLPRGGRRFAPSPAAAR